MELTVNVKWLKRITPAGIEAGAAETVVLPCAACWRVEETMEAVLGAKYHTQMACGRDFEIDAGRR